MTITTSLKSPKKKKKVAPILSKDKYIKSVLPMQFDESHVRYTPVGDFHFRVVFFRSIQSENSVMVEHKLCRTYFVKVKQDDKGKWVHEIIDKNHFI